MGFTLPLNVDMLRCFLKREKTTQMIHKLAFSSKNTCFCFRLKAVANRTPAEAHNSRKYYFNLQILNFSFFFSCHMCKNV